MMKRTIPWSFLALPLAAFALGCGGDDSREENDDSDDGIWRDDTSGLDWQDPPPSATYTWSNAASYCDNLVHGGHSDWRLPDIDELISLIRGCVDGTATGDLSPSACVMTPAGCAATDSCDGVGMCGWCADWNGPGADGCYWDPRLGGTCSWYWSSSLASNTSSVWSVNYYNGYMGGNFDMTFSGHTRCVRDH